MHERDGAGTVHVHEGQERDVSSIQIDLKVVVFYESGDIPHWSRSRGGQARELLMCGYVIGLARHQKYLRWFGQRREGRREGSKSLIPPDCAEAYTNGGFYRNVE